MFRTKTTGLNLPGRAFPTSQRDFQRVWMRKTTDAPHNGSVVRTDRVCSRSSTTCSSIHLGTSHGRVDWCQTSCTIFICRERLTQSSCTPNICFLERPPSPEAVFFITLHQPASHGASSHHNAPCSSRSTAIMKSLPKGSRSVVPLIFSSHLSSSSLSHSALFLASRFPSRHSSKHGPLIVVSGNQGRRLPSGLLLRPHVCLCRSVRFRNVSYLAPV